MTRNATVSFPQPRQAQVLLLFDDPELEDAVTAWHGAAVAGGLDYTDEQKDQVLAWLRDHAPTQEEAKPLEQLVTELGIAGRTVHEILRDADGRELVIAYHKGKLIHVANTREEAAPFTRRLRDMADSLIERVERREAFELDELQPGLFDAP